MTTENTRTYDVIVIGAGPVGENVADRTTAAGLSTLIVESELAGGECSYWACEPSKALLRPALVRADAAHMPGIDPAVAGPLDVDAVLAHRDRMSADWKDDGQVEWIKSAGIDLLRGHGRLAGEREVTVETPDGDTVRLRARHAVAVCTGSRAALPPLPGIEQLRPWTSREATSARRVPRRLVIVGAGVVGVEMATAWQALGSEVTLLAREDGLLPRMEPFAGELVTERLREAGADVRFGVSVVDAKRADGTGGEVRVWLSDGSELAADEILFATGRAPRSQDIGLDTVGLEPGDWLTVDDSLTVSAVPGEWLYAVGDVNRRALFTHQGKYQARIAGSVIAARARGERLDAGRWTPHSSTADVEAVPGVVFTDPTIASVGLTVREAEHTGRDVEVVDYEIGHLAGAVQYRPGYRGRARIVIDRDRQVVVGATFVGPGVEELVYSATVAITGEVPVERLWHAVPAFPTLSEVWLRLLETRRDS
ncbi:dihydrolipoyl dehydrogenase family protein [Streptomyces justiciae]|uniref:dihydrolipoyl dehydrogenase family protein n=1 Tax=Streptomyces justiciae TaxID=2780140 RepID=UPI001882E32D|nr:NAD(P)/FAD-dependent oxidoreductase [Streptomyces justiciae]MBE8478023.1 NAD(P)/FAD-dependent oxidoreductase [Streptomyces justiciae]MCW8383706.1 NAD(P)/FAD-dependent oxidoreductase [Streptomyces justiciae]